MACRPPLDRYAHISNWHGVGYYVPDGYLHLDGPSGYLYNRQGQPTYVGDPVWKDLALKCQQEREKYYTGQKGISWPGLVGTQAMATPADYAYPSTAGLSHGSPSFVQFSDGQVSIHWGPQGNVGALHALSRLKGYNPPFTQPPTTYWFT
jgi:hypothetical protein